MNKWLIRDKKSSADDLVAFGSSASESKSTAGQDEKIPSKIRKITRKYDPQYINIGFTVTDVNNEPRPQCVICFEILSNHRMKPSLLKRHLSTKHSMLENKHKDYFVRKLTKMKSTKKIVIFYWNYCKSSGGIFLSESKNSKMRKSSYHR